MTEALVYAGATAVASYVAVRDDLPGEPFGVTVPVTVRTGVLLGWGSGISAPWPMPAIALLMALRSGRGHTNAALVASVIGLASVVGHLIEPVTRRPRSWTAGATACIVLASASAIRLAAVGSLRYLDSRAS